MLRSSFVIRLTLIPVLLATMPARSQPSDDQPQPQPQPQPTTETTAESEATPADDALRRRNRDQADRPVPFQRPSEGQQDPRANIEFPIVIVQPNASSVFRSMSDLDSTSNGFSVAAFEAGVDTLIVASPALTFRIGVSTEVSYYDWDGSEPLLADTPDSDDPFDSAQRHEIGTTAIIRSSQTTTWIAGASINSSYESGADFNDSIGGQFLGGGTYAFNDDLTLGFGLNIIFDLDGEPDVIPLPFVEWRFAEGWELASNSRGVNITYERSDTLKYGVGARFLGREFRLDDDGPIPGGIANDNSVAVAAFVEWDVSNELKLEFGAGAQVYSEFELINRRDVRVFESDSDPAFVGVFRATLSF